MEAHAREMALQGQGAKVRDEGLLQSACARPVNRAHYDDAATIYDISAEMAFGLARNHCFIDGNKRAAFAAAYMTLKMNGVTPDWTNREAIATFTALANGEIGQTELARWLSENCLEQG